MTARLRIVAVVASVIGGCLVAGVPHADAAGAHAITITSPQTFNENAGTAVVQVTVSPGTDADEMLSVEYATVDGSATAGQDYTSTMGTLIIGPNTSTSHIDVPIVDDNGAETDETFFIDLAPTTAPTCTETTPSNPVCAASVTDGNGTASGDGTVVIRDNDGPPRTASVSDASTNEGNAATFTVTLSAACSTGSTTVPFDTRSFSTGQPSGTASEGTDYPRAQGALVFDTGVTSRTFTVNTVEDTIDESDETFGVFLGTPSGTCPAAIDDGTGQGTIVDDDPGGTSGVTIAIENRRTNERDSGTHVCQMTVRLSAPATAPVTVHWSTADGTATAGEDYLTATGVLSFDPGQTIGTVSPLVIGDNRNEPGRRERFFVNLDNLTGPATMSDDQGRCIIYEGRGG